MTWLDLVVMEWVAEHRGPVGDAVAFTFMALGTRPAAMAVGGAVVLIYALLRRRFRLLAAVAVAAVLAPLIAGVLKAIVAQPRPLLSDAVVVAGGWSMPSTAAMLSAAVATAGYVCLDGLAPRMRRLVGVVLAVGVATTGWSVVYLGAHWVTDVLAGWVLGAALGVGVGLAVTSLGDRDGKLGARGSRAGRA